MVSAKARVLHLIASDGMYGAESVIVNLSREMQKGGLFEPIVGCIVQRDGEAVELERVARANGLRTAILRINNFLVLWDLPRAAAALRRQNITIVHAHGYKPAIYAYLLSYLAGCRAMATCHLWFLGRGSPLRMRAMIWIEKRLYKQFPLVAAVSGKIRQILIANGVAPDRAWLIRNGIPINERQSKRPRALSDEPMVVLNVARLTQQKAQGDLVAAAAACKARGLPVRFMIVGEGELRAELEQEIAELGVADVVELAGFCQDIPALLGAADIFALPSIDEGMPISLLEAVEAGLPVVTTAVGDIPELIENDISGLIVAVHDVQALARAIERLVRDRSVGKLLADNARQRLQDRFSSNSMYRQYVKMYERLA